MKYRRACLAAVNTREIKATLIILISPITVILIYILINLNTFGQQISYSDLKNKPFVTVTDSPYLAKCDGVTNDSAAFSAAITAATSLGGVVQVPPRTCVVNNVVLPSNIWIRGSGVGATTIKLLSGSNTNVFTGANFASLNNTVAQVPETRGANFVTITDLTIDGNKAFNSAGWGIQIWGHSMYWQNVTVQNCATGGIFTEYSDGSGGSFFPSNPKLGLPEAIFASIKTSYNNGNGWTFEGPNDSTWNGLISSGDTGWAIQFLTRTGYYLGSADLVLHANCYGEGTGCYNEGPNAGALNWDTVLVTDSPIGLTMDSTDGDEKMVNMTVNGNTNYGIWLQGAGNHFIGEVTNNGTGMILNGSQMTIDVHGNGNDTAIASSSSISTSRIFASFAANMGQVILGSGANITCSNTGIILDAGSLDTLFTSYPSIVNTCTDGQSKLTSVNPVTQADYVAIYHSGTSGYGYIDALGTGDLNLQNNSGSSGITRLGKNIAGSGVQGTYEFLTASFKSWYPYANTTSSAENIIISTANAFSFRQYGDSAASFPGWGMISQEGTTPIGFTCGSILCGKFSTNGLTLPIVKAVGTLPTCNSTTNLYTILVVTDALTPTYLNTLTGGGSKVTPVLCNGTAWISF